MPLKLEPHHHAHLYEDAIQLTLDVALLYSHPMVSHTHMCVEELMPTSVDFQWGFF